MNIVFYKLRPNASYENNLINYLVDGSKKFGDSIFVESGNKIHTQCDAAIFFGVSGIRERWQSNEQHGINNILLDKGYIRNLNIRNVNCYYRVSINSFQPDKFEEYPADRFNKIESHLKLQQKCTKGEKYTLCAFPTKKFYQFYFGQPEQPEYERQVLADLKKYGNKVIVSRKPGKAIPESTRDIISDTSGINNILRTKNIDLLWTEASNCAIDALTYGCPVVSKNHISSLHNDRQKIFNMMCYYQYQVKEFSNIGYDFIRNKCR